MPRAARTLVSIATLVAVALVGSGCAATEGPHVPTSSKAGSTASEQIGGTSVFDRVTGNHTLPSGVSHDISTYDSVEAGYGGVPGATMLETSGALDTLGYEDDVMSSTAVSNLSFDDPSLTSLTLNDGLSLDTDPTSTLSFDAAMTDASDLYGGGMGGDMNGLDTLDDMALEADPMLEDPMLDDPMLDAGIEDPMW